jgi:multidrug efflux system membrane fusion protein
MQAGSLGHTGPGRIMLVALPIICLVAGCAQETAPPSDMVRPVKTVVVTAGGASRTRSLPGKVEASRKAELAFLVSGLLVKLPFKEGQRVAKGEMIAQLRQDEFQAQLTNLQSQLDQARADLTALKAGERTEQRERLEAQLRAAEATLAKSEADFNRHEGLLRSNAISRAAYERAEAAYHVALEEQRSARQLLEKAMTARQEVIEAKEAEVRGLEARVAGGNIQLADSTLVAPFNGVVATRFVEEQQSVRAKDRIVLFQDVDEILIAADVPEAVMFAQIRSTDIEQIFAEFSGSPGLKFPVHIAEVAQAADPVTQTFTVRVAMKVPTDVNLLPGMTARVTLVYRRANAADNRLMVPVSAVFNESTGEQVVWVVGPDQTVTRRSVKIGEPSGSQIEIVDGLQSGDRIAVAGVSFLRQGMKVRDLGAGLGGS